MSKPVSTSPSTPSRRPPLFKMAGIGCGTLFGIFLVALLILFAKYNEPYNAADELTALAGVPPYPGATIDEESTRMGRAVAVLMRGRYPADRSAVVGLRTKDDPKAIVAFYDGALMKFGFTKTRLGGGAGTDGASYVLDGTTVVVQVQNDEGEDHQLLVTRFDTGIPRILGRQSDVVLPEDFKKKR